MQPTYMPWAGYFNLIAQADHFVFLDDVQYERQSWQNRNRVLVDGQTHWLTVPAVRESLGEPIDHVLLDDRQPWRIKHVRLIEQSYAKHPFVADLEELLAIVLDGTITHLADLNIAIILRAAKRLGLSSSIARASELGITGQRSERLLRFCEYFQCDEYLSPVGSADYLAADGVFDRGRVRLRLQHYTPAAYPQLRASEFTSHLSFLDVLANIGWSATGDYVVGRDMSQLEASS